MNINNKNMDNLNVTVDSNILQEKAKEFAMKGALKAIEDYYTGYDSPFKKLIIEQLSQNSIDAHSLSLPDIIALINEHLTIEIDAIANTAVAKTFIPLVTRFLTRQEKAADFSDILKEFIETAGYSDKEPDDFNVCIEENEKWEWLTIEVSDLKRSYTFTLHMDSESKKAGHKKYKLLSMPHTEKTEVGKMKLQIDNASLELPFTRDILKDQFVSYLAGFVISDTIITMDTRDFDEEMFPDRCHC